MASNGTKLSSLRETGKSGTVQFEQYTVHYTVFGNGEEVVLLLPGAIGNQIIIIDVE